MLDNLKRLFARELAPAASSQPERDHEIRVATAALLFEVVRADGSVEQSERSMMRAAVRSTFDLAPGELEELIRLAEEASARAVSLYEFTQVLDAAFSPEEKKRVVELLWLVSFADDRKHPVEEQMIRRVAGLLHVSHPDFIDAKIRARSAGGETPA
jgi:uncharacterized tellurite resistance protein B-like protein